jgi:hypothetical protein
MTTSTPSQPTMGEYLVREGFITQAQFNRALAEQGNTTKSLGRILVELGLISENMRINVLQRRFGFDLARLKDYKASAGVLARIPYNFAEKHRVVPLALEGSTLVVAMEDPSDILICDMIKNQVGMPIRACVASNEDIQNVLDQYVTGSSEIKAAQTDNKPRRRPPSRAARIMRSVGMPLIAALPMVVFALALYFNFFGAADELRRLYDEQIIVSMFDLSIYIALVWGLWSVVVYEINALIFGRHGDEEEEL